MNNLAFQNAILIEIASFRRSVTINANLIFIKILAVAMRLLLTYKAIFRIPWVAILVMIISVFAGFCTATTGPGDSS